MSDRAPSAPPETEFVGPNPLVAALRRWPLLAVGLAIGIVIGLSIYLFTPPTYQSASQLLVVKKRIDVVQAFSGVLMSCVPVVPGRFKQSAGLMHRCEELQPSW